MNIKLLKKLAEKELEKNARGSVGVRGGTRVLCAIAAYLCTVGNEKKGRENDDEVQGRFV